MTRSSKPVLEELLGPTAGAASSQATATGSLRGRVLASLARDGRYGSFADRLARLFGISIAEAHALLRAIETDAPWQDFLVEGTAIVAVTPGAARDGATAMLVRLRPGVSFPPHAHRGEETMVVIDGGFREVGPAAAADSDLREVWAGEELTRGDGTHHGLVALDGQPCIAAVLIRGYVDFD